MVCLLIAIALSLMSTSAMAEQVLTRHGGDTYLSGSGTTAPLSSERDVFAAGWSLTVTGEIADDLQAAGYAVDVEAVVGGDIQTAGSTVVLRSQIGEDVDAAAGSLRLSTESLVGGNARLAGGTVTLDGTIRGAVAVAGGEVIVNGTIVGDARITAGTLRFGPDASIGGRLIYLTHQEIDIPNAVISGDRVSWTRLEPRTGWQEMRESWGTREYPTLPAARSIFAGFFISLAFLLVVGATFLAFAARQVQKLRVSTLDAPGTTLLLGVIGLSMLFGLVPITAMTIVGVPFVPFGLMAIIVLWTLGYLLGAYVAAMRMWQAFVSGESDPNMAARLTILAAGIFVAGLLNFIPFVGWTVNFSLVLLGIGAFTRVFFEWLVGEIAKP